MDISVLHYLAEFIKADLPIIVLERHNVISRLLTRLPGTHLVVKDDRLVHDLLELSVLQVRSNHHLEDLRKVSSML